MSRGTPCQPTSASKMRQAGGELVLTVHDQLASASPTGLAERGAAMGLLGIRERAYMLGGRLEVDNPPGAAAASPCACAGGPRSRRRRRRPAPDTMSTPSLRPRSAWLLVDDHTIVREGLKRILESTGEAGTSPRRARFPGADSLRPRPSTLASSTSRCPGMSGLELNPSHPRRIPPLPCWCSACTPRRNMRCAPSRSAPNRVMSPRTAPLRNCCTPCTGSAPAAPTSHQPGRARRAAAQRPHRGAAARAAVQSRARECCGASSPASARRTSRGAELSVRRISTHKTRIMDKLQLTSTAASSATAWSTGCHDGDPPAAGPGRCSDGGPASTIPGTPQLSCSVSLAARCLRGRRSGRRRRHGCGGRGAWRDTSPRPRRASGGRVGAVGREQRDADRAETTTVRPCSSIGASIASCQLARRGGGGSGTGDLLQHEVNSSPPRRATVSSARTPRAGRAATMRSSSSPAARARGCR